MAKEKPYPEFPLFAHQNGQWAKKIRKKTYYFGTDWQSALSEYRRVVDDLQAGREPMPSGQLTILELVNRFLDAKMSLVESGELSIRTWQTYKAAAETICEVLGRELAVMQLRVEDFDRLRQKLSQVRGHVSLGNEVQRVRSIFKYAYEAGLIEQPVRFGPHFRKPPQKVVRQQKHNNGKRLFSAHEIRTLFYVADRPADLQLRAMILLGLNCAFGQTDISSLPFSALDQQGWVEFPRPKTAVFRRCPLWPETEKAIREVIDRRRKPKSAKFRELVFLTRLGQPWVRASDQGVPIDQVGKQFTKLMTACGIRRPGVNFYALRHTFETIGGESKDQVAVDWIMGHITPGMGTNYRHIVSDERLLAVSNLVREWLFPRPFSG